MEEAFLPRSPLSIYLALILHLSPFFPCSVCSTNVPQSPCLNEYPVEIDFLRSFYRNQAALTRNGPCVCEWIGVTCDPKSGRVTALNLSNYGLVGILPDLSQLTYLSTIHLSHNNFDVSMPPWFSSLKRLKSLNLSWNNLTEIPSGLWNSPDSKLETLGLGANLLGVFDDQQTNLRNLIDSLARCRHLQELDLSGNRFLGPLPDSVGKLSANLTILDLSRNNLTGAIPNQLFTLSSLYVLLDLSHNQFNGSLPQDVGNLINLVALDVSHNNLSGEIPSSLGKCKKLELLYLQNNNFSGNISSGSFNELHSIREINLSQNNLSGTIPPFLACLTHLQLLNVSFNNFEGAVPSGGIFNRINSSSFYGNKRLRTNDKQPSSPCDPTALSPTPDISLSGKSKSELPKAALPAIIVIAILILLVLLLYLFYKYNCFANDSSGGFSKDISFPKASLRVTYANLQMATKGFSHSCLIGVGGTGCVYRGFLEHRNKEVAVKVLDRDVLGDLKSFKEECKNMESIEHKNLVKVLASCAGANSNGDQFKALVYELMPNGNLEMWLHEEVEVSQLKPSKKWNLSLYQRLNIAIDVASALVHLHCQLKNPIVHCNLKPSNILLTEDITAQVTDLCMNRFYRIDKVVMKSTGYIAPELTAGNPISPSWDVYSFGIILLEMFTGKRPTDEELNSTGNPNHPLRYVFQRYPLDIEDIVDPLLLSEETGGKLTERTPSCVTSIIHTAVICSKELPEDRMEMREALEKLENAKLALLDAGCNGMAVYENFDRAGSSDEMLG